MKRKIYIENINRYFAYLVTQIQCNTACGLFDINAIAEDFYIPILKYLYDCKALENKNIIKVNFPSIDLGCDISRKSFQITSENGSEKICHTLEKFRDNNLDESYDEVYILIIIKKQINYSSKKLEKEILRQKISFDKDVHIIDYTDLISKINKLKPEKLKGIYEILDREFSKHDTFNICRDELDNFLLISNDKIETEKNTKKYIPSVFTESTKTKDQARFFSHPLFFYRKIEDKLLSINYELLNKFLSMMDVEQLSSEIHTYIGESSPSSIIDISLYLISLKELIVTEKEKISDYNPWGKKEPRPDFKVPAGKEAIKTLLKYQMESLCYGIDKKYDDIFELIKLCLSKIFLVTSMAGQGKTNFVCDLIENQFKLFDIPSIFIPARELNSYATSTLLFSHLIKNRYLSTIDNLYELFEFFDQTAKEINKPFIIVIDGINEVKDLDRFNLEICEFLDAISQFDFVKVIITCRSEFFEQRYSDILNQPFSQHIYHVSDLKADMSEGNLERILCSYLNYFNITANLSIRATDFLKDDLLLLRIFCELNQNKKIGNVDEIFKDQLYEEYLIVRIEGFDTTLKKHVLPTFYAIADEMISNDQYTGLVIENFNTDQAKIIEQLVFEDVILRRELPEKTLETAGGEAIGFTYDELRDFIISHYLVNKLSIDDFDKFTEFFSRLPSLQVNEGVFKYLYILSKKENKESILAMCEAVTSFDEHYSTILWSLPPEYQSEDDIIKVTAILSANEEKNAVSNIALFLYQRKDKNEFLNIEILVKHINSLDDSEYDKFFETIFSDRYFNKIDLQKRIDKFIERWLESLRNDENKSHNEYFKFWLQVTAKSSSWLQHEVIVICAQIKERDQRLDCFEYISNATSSKIKSLASSIKTNKEKNDEA